MSRGLVFDETSAGTLEGIHDAGIETFQGNPLPSLAREQAQNALDAHRDGVVTPVSVEYKLRKLTASEFPGLPELSSAIDDLLKFWKDRTSKEDPTITILDRAKKVASQAGIAVLHITDRNTTGLTGSDRADGGNWIGLTKAAGLSAKDAGKGGSFGIGKNVFWANSRLRTVFFSTHDEEGKWAFQGVTKLAGRIGKRGVTYRATAYYGERNRCEPIKGESNIPPYFRPKGIGTDVFIAGFEVRDDWDLDLVEAFAENFFVAFHNNKLEVKIEDEALTRDTIALTIDQMYGEKPNRDPSLRNYFDALTSPEAEVREASIDGIGKVRLRLLVREGANKWILAFRATGMRIKELTHFRTPVQFAGVLLCDDPIGNQFLRSIENPRHDDWEANRHATDPRDAKKTLDRLSTWVKEQVASLSPIANEQELDVPDLGQLLPDDSEPEFDPVNPQIEGDMTGKDEELLGRVRKKRPNQRPRSRMNQASRAPEGTMKEVLG